MKRLTYGLLCVAVVSLLASVSVASTPTVTVYFDEAMTMRSVDRLSPGQHTLYIVAEGFDAFLTAIEYKIEYPAGMTWLEDIDMPPVKIGNTTEGIAQAWTKPVDAHSPVVVAKALVRWEPTDRPTCELTVVPYPGSPSVRATVAPDHRIVEAKGQTSYGGSDNELSLTRNVPALYGANPNPFKPATQITYWVPEKGHVQLSVYDVAGRLIATLVDDVRDGGEHTVGWRASDLPSGVYFCRLVVGEFTESKKMMLLK
ncbi:MAG: T9SS type A sorting domain-containing protein [Candidatus Latescibacterota bacterium]|nr:MAG: T9SS type A sorting domain-containing protein [Candidatus Latescibacterota bacterium]